MRNSPDGHWGKIQSSVQFGGSRGKGRRIYQSPPNSDQNAQFTFSSFHPAGTNFLAADGSVKLIAETIDRAAYHALCTRAGGDVVPDF